MLLNLVIENYSMDLPLDDNELVSLSPLFVKMDLDMDNGVQLGSSWVDKPSKIERAQVAAERLLNALHTDNENLAKMMGGYMVKRLTDLKSVHIDSNGSPAETTFHY